MGKTPKSRTQQLQGIVLAHNLSPKGHVEGVLVATSKGTVQLNLPKHGEAGPRFAVGTQIDAAAVLDDDGDGEHPVYELAEAPRAVHGTVVRFNYARHGEVNGYHLDGGVFVHVKPDGARRYKVKPGNAIAAEGEARPGPDATVLEATRVTKRARA